MTKPCPCCGNETPAQELEDYWGLCGACALEGWHSDEGATAVTNDFDDLELCLIRNGDGKYLRRKGLNGYGECWTDRITQASLFHSVAAARGQVTWWAKHFGEYGAPTILKLTIGEVEYLDETARVEKVTGKKIKKVKPKRKTK